MSERTLKGKVKWVLVNGKCDHESADSCWVAVIRNFYYAAIRQGERGEAMMDLEAFANMGVPSVADVRRTLAAMKSASRRRKEKGEGEAVPYWAE